MNSHVNNGSCEKCLEIFRRYPNFNIELKIWFTDLQKKYPDAHISCAGRGKADQEQAFNLKASRAHYGQSAHNCNQAIDIFQQDGHLAKWDQEWFDMVIGANLDKCTAELKWYGAPGAEFFERPHVEIANWRDLLKSGAAKLVEF